MAEITSFRGLRYRLNRPDELGQYTAPPYDMVDDAMIDALYAKSPYNTIRLIQNKAEPTDSCNRDRHRRAAALFSSWINEQRLVQDAAPSVYVYKQTFTLGATTYARTGVIALIKLVDFEEGIVQPHEYTLSGPKIDRYELLEELKCDTGLIFGIVPDDGAFLAAIQEAAGAAPDGQFTDRDNVRHELFQCDSRDAISKLQSLMAARTILIADGHHRYETSLNYYRATGKPGNAYVMMSLVSMADPGLVIRPFHRLVKNNELSAKLTSVRDCAPFFDLTDLGGASAATVHSFLGGSGDSDLLFYDPTDKHLWGLKANSGAEKYLAEKANGMSALWNHLNVSIINRLVVEGVMGQPLDGKILHDVMDYVNDAEVAFGKVTGEPGYKGGFFIRPIDIQTVKQVVSQKERMPQKSTNFFPKLYSGLVFNPLERE